MQKKKNKNIKELNLKKTIVATFFGHAIILIIAALISQLSSNSAVHIWHLPNRPNDLAIIAIGSLIPLSLFYLAQCYFPELSMQKDDLFNRVRDKHSQFAFFYLLTVSSFIEEFIFRGILLSWIGPVPTAMFAALFYLGAGGVLTAWSVFMLAFHYWQNFIFAATGSIFASMVTGLLFHVFLALYKPVAKAKP